MDFKLEVEGLKEMEMNLLTLGANLGASALRSALRDSGKPLEDYMLANAPVAEHSRIVKKRGGEKVRIDPGFLKSRIKRKSSLNKKGRLTRKFKKNQVAVVQIGAFRVPYVVQVEYGTRNNKAFNFIRGAKDVAPQSVSIFRTRLKHRIKLAERKLLKARK